MNLREFTDIQVLLKRRRYNIRGNTLKKKPYTRKKKKTVIVSQTRKKKDFATNGPHAQKFGGSLFSLDYWKPTRSVFLVVCRLLGYARRVVRYVLT